MPKMQFKSNAKPSLYAYPTPTREEKEKEKAKVGVKINTVIKFMCNNCQVSTAILSVTAKAQAKSKKKEESAPPVEAMEVHKL